ncbi:MAG: TonB-dependent receptor [Gammaproteobacteria bacterium]|nr:TonB-dependent receptor [Gammaproteobacteria bacterium]
MRSLMGFTSRFVFFLGLFSLTLPLPVTAQEGRSSVLLEDVVVTARKREESLQDAPVAVSAFSGDQLEFRGITDIGQIEHITPNLVLRKSPTNSNVINAAAYIRGIGQNDFVPVLDPGVGIYVDGVYLGRSVGGILDIVDIERIEVLRGPQGTLFGRNTIGGAVDIKTRKPNEDFGGKFALKAGTDGLVHVRGTVNIPMAETFYGRFSFGVFQQDGYVIRPFDGLDLGNDDSYGLRGAFRWVPNDDLEFNFTVDYSEDDENGNPYVITGIQPLNFGLATGGAPSMTTAQNTIVAQLENGGIMPGNGGPFFDPAGGFPGLPPPFPFNFNECFTASVNNGSCYNQNYIDDGSKNQNFSTDPNFQKLEVWGVNLSVDWNLTEDLTLKSITAYREFDGHFEGDQDGGPQRVSYLIDIYDHEQISQEFQLLGSSFDDRLDWIAGFYYYEEEGLNINPVRFSQVYLQSGGEYEFESIAVFGQATWKFTDELEATVGLRWTEDTRNYRPDQFIEFFPIGPLPVDCPAEPSSPCAVGDRVLPFEFVETKNDEILPYVNIAYNFTDSLLGYASYSEGYKSGGYTQRIFPPEPSLPDFDPEFAKSYEIGFKFDGWEDRLRLNFAAFFTEYEDLQLLVADPSRVGPFVDNAGDAEIWGIEIEAVLTPGGGWVLTGALGYNEPDRTRVSGQVQGITEDSRFEHISDWTANAQAYYEIGLGEWGFLTPRVEWSFRSEYGTNANNVPRDGAPVAPGFGDLSFGVPNPQLREDDLHLLHVSVRWDVRDSGLALSTGVTNLTDEEYRVFGNFQDSFGFTQETFHRGREFFVEGIYEF